MITKYHRFSDAEFLSYLDSRRQHSEILEELCTRLEEREAPELEGSAKATCSVCGAEVNIEYDVKEESFQLKL